MWSSWETGAHVPATALELQAVADVLRADPAWLLGLTDERRPWPAGAAPHAPAEPSPQPTGEGGGGAEMPGDLVTLAEAAKVIGVSRQAVHRAVVRGRLRAYG